MPSNTPLGWNSLRVSFNGTEGGPVPVFVADHALGIFTATGAGMGPGVIQNVNSESDRPINSPAATARPRQVVILWATGLSPITAPDNQAPPAADLPLPVEILVGGARVTNKLYSGRSPCCAGVDQIAFEVPPEAPAGCYVPVLIRIGSRVSNGVTMAISPNGGACSDPDNPLVAPFVSGQRLGILELTRISLFLDTGVNQIRRAAVDRFAALFQKQTGGQFAFNPMIALPPPGACTAYTASGYILGGVVNPFAARSAGLNAGTLTLTGTAGTVTHQGQQIGAGRFYNAIAAGPTVTIPAGGPDPAIFFEPGNYVLRASGGPDVGAFETNVAIEPPLVWTNRDSLASVDRAQGVRFEWNATPKGRAVVGGSAYDMPTDTSTIFVCVAPAGASSFQVPPEVLANILPARPQRHQSIHNLFFATAPAGAAVPFTAPGLDSAAVVHKTVTYKSVRFR